MRVRAYMRECCFVTHKIFHVMFLLIYKRVTKYTLSYFTYIIPEFASVKQQYHWRVAYLNLVGIKNIEIKTMIMNFLM